MQKIFCGSVLLVLLCAQGALANEGNVVRDAQTPVVAECRERQTSEDVSLVGRGCCSHHRGQCGCEGGRVVCCDGSLSPSCRCEADTPVTVEN